MTEEENSEPGQEEDREQGDVKTGVKVECQMETSKQKTVTFEFHTTDIGPEEMANTFIMEDLLAEQHRRILVEQLIDIANQLADDPETVPQVRINLDYCDLVKNEGCPAIPKRMNFRKSSGGGEVIFNPQIYIAEFYHYKRYFGHEFWKKIAI